MAPHLGGFRVELALPLRLPVRTCPYRRRARTLDLMASRARTDEAGGAGPAVADVVRGSMPARPAPRSGRPADLRHLQRLAGNAAVSRAIERWQAGSQSGVGHPPALTFLQRDQAIGPPTAPGAIDADLEAARQSGRWRDVATALDRFGDVDLGHRAARLSGADRTQTRQACPVELSRVRGSLLDADWTEAVAAADWNQAAVTVNGFDDRGIAAHIAALAPDVLTDFAAAAVRSMTGVSRTRVLDGIRARYDVVSTDALGTRVLTVVGLMQQSGVPDAAAAAYARLRLGLRSAAQAAEPGRSTGTDQSRSDQLVAAAMGGAFVPRGPQPPALAAGNLAHTLIGGIYEGLNPMSFYDLPAAAFLARLATRFRARGAANDLLTNLDMRPDIVDLARLQVYEIKPLNLRSLAVAEVADYIELLNGLLKDGVAGFRPGSPGNPGATGVLPFTDQGRQGTLVWGCPVPGAILYTFVDATENPEHVRARINEPQGLGLGVESMVALGLVGAAGLAAVPEALGAGALAGDYGTLIANLVRGATLAGQRIPALIGAGAGVAGPVKQ